MNDLIAFLTARLDDAAERARFRKSESTQYAGFETDPDDVLRDVEADRRLLAEWQKAEADPAIDDEWNAGFAAGLRLAVQIRAARYGDHPDYRPEWAPGA